MPTFLEAIKASIDRRQYELQAQRKELFIFYKRLVERRDKRQTEELKKKVGL